MQTFQFTAGFIRQILCSVANIICIEWKSEKNSSGKQFKMSKSISQK